MIYIEGKSPCRLCGLEITRRSDFVGFPKVILPLYVQDISDSCLHRQCIENHPHRKIFKNAWSEWWIDYAAACGDNVYISKKGLSFQKGDRIVCVLFNNFFYIEEKLADLNLLKDFFSKAFSSSQLQLSWFTYKLKFGKFYINLVIDSNRKDESFKQGTVFDYSFSKTDWEEFVNFWTYWGL